MICYIFIREVYSPFLVAGFSLSGPKFESLYDSRFSCCTVRVSTVCSSVCCISLLFIAICCPGVGFVTLVLALFILVF